MRFLDYLKEQFKPVLPVRQDIIERERYFNEQDKSRESLVLDHIYLCEGGLEALKQHPDFNAIGQGIEYVIASYESPNGKRGPCKPVSVNILMDSDEKISVNLLEKKLKLDLYTRGCNAGVFYIRHQKGKFLYAEAVPATLSGE
jgi:hypothetical protein